MKVTVKKVSVLLFFVFLHFVCLNKLFAQKREDLPLYHTEQQKKEQTLFLLNKLLQNHEGIYLYHDSVKQVIRTDSIRRYNLLKKPKTLQYGNRKTYRD
jgi:hypothetical protein